MVLHNTGGICVAWKMGISLRTRRDIEQQNLKAELFVFLSYELWIELLHRIWSGWNIISEADPYLLNLSFVSLILWAVPSCFIVSGPKLWSRGEPRRAAQAFALVRDTQRDIGILSLNRQEVTSSAAKSEGKRGNFRIYCLPLHDGKLEIHTGISTVRKCTCGNSVVVYLFPILFTIPFIFFKESEQFKLTYPLIENNWNQSS